MADGICKDWMIDPELMDLRRFGHSEVELSTYKQNNTTGVRSGSRGSIFRLIMPWAWIVPLL